MIRRFFARLVEAWGYVGLGVGRDRIGLREAWDLACVRHPSPKVQAKHDAETLEVIRHVWEMRERERLANAPRTIDPRYQTTVYPGETGREEMP